MIQVLQEMVYLLTLNRTGATNGYSHRSIMNGSSSVDIPGYVLAFADLPLVNDSSGWPDSSTGRPSISEWLQKI